MEKIIEQLEYSIMIEKSLLALAQEGLEISYRTRSGEYLYWAFEIIKYKNRLAQLNKALENLKSKSVVVEIKFPPTTSQSDVDNIIRQIKEVINKYNTELVIK